MICRTTIRKGFDAMKIKVAILFGGNSVEHEVSVISGIQAVMSISREDYDVTPVYIAKDGSMYVGPDVGDIDSYKDIPALIERSERVVFVKEGEQAFMVSYPFKWRGGEKIPVDLAFPIVHGKNVEDGALPGYFRTIGVPFATCDIASASLCMDKYNSKIVLKANDVPVLDGYCYTTKDYANIDTLADDIEGKLGYPVIVKPVDLGSSVGIGVAKDRSSLIDALDDAFTYAGKILVEHAITNLREINCAVLGDENEAVASECEEPLHTEDILSYEDKYMSSGGKSGGSKGMAGVSRKIPAEITPERREMIRNLAIKAFQVLGCNGVARIDFLWDDDTDEIYFNEINTIPGSMSFYLFEPIGMKYETLLDGVIKLALKRQREEVALTFSFDTNLLSNNALSGTKGNKV